MVVTDKSSGDKFLDTDSDSLGSNAGVVESGCKIYEQDTPSLTVNVEAGTIWVQEKRVSVSSTTKTLSAADATNERIDLIVVGSDGTVDIVEGTPAASPTTPDIPAGHIGLARISVPATDTTITNDQITDLRNLIGSGLVLIQSASGTSTDVTEAEFDTTTTFADGRMKITDYYFILVTWNHNNANGTGGQITVRYTQQGNQDIDEPIGTTQEGFMWIRIMSITGQQVTFTKFGADDGGNIDVRTVTGNESGPTTSHQISLRGYSGHASDTLDWAWSVWRFET